MEDGMGERCGWCGTDPLYVAYHDDEWGVPERDPRALYEKLVLDGFQAGLSWYTILRKRENFRAAFAGFDPDVIATWGEPEVTRLLADAGIVRHRGKIEAAITNAQAWQRVEASPGGFTDFIWSAVDGVPVQNGWTELGQIPATSPVGDVLAKRLKQAGFRFCGPTIVYAFAQAVGLVNDHIVDCPAFARCTALSVVEPVESPDATP
jgi:DNA-3-methyladenine glycosylase I